ncbi:CU044_5270 family protein (plasmid) [Streptomyces sp. NBC_00868]|uniref:CU044_5270 family protein n=1 Tax=Streptomyces sp. NBC_00868 TaxID=2903683 RepID=UPI002F906819|nr:CU044_5270 family protein [Streptomyces sp. NBC_00868]
MDSFETLKSLDTASGYQWRMTEADREELLREVLRRPAMASPSQHGVLHRWRWPLTGLAAVASAAVLALAFVLLGPGPQPAYALTPPALHYQESGESAKAVLERIAASAEGDKSPVPPGGTQYFERETWSLSTRIDGIQVTSAVIPEVRQVWKKPDGSLTWKARTKRPQFQTSHDREVWEDAGSVGQDPKSYGDSTGPADMRDVRNQPAPDDVTRMGTWLATGYEAAGPGEIFDSVSERNLNSMLTGQQRASQLRFLATLPGVEYRGSVRDRAGRVGHAFSVDSKYGGLPKKQTLIFDVSSGKLLAYEEELTTDAGKLNVKTPAVIMYVCYLTARFD